MSSKLRPLLVSAALVLGVGVPVPWASALTPAATTPSVPAQSDAAAQTPLNGKSPAEPAPPRPVTAGSLRGLAAEQDASSVVIAIKVRAGAKSALAAVTEEARAQGGQRRRVLRQLNTLTVQVPQADATALIASMRDRKDVARVELVVQRSLTFIPDDQKYPATASYLNAVTAPAAWDVHRGDPGLRIAVVDSGVDTTHPDLSGRVAGTYNAVTGGTDVTDVVGHGTFVAGVAAATGDNGIGIAGASMGASVLAVKVADAKDEIWTDALAAGIVWAADHGAKVINLSLGGTTSSQLERDAVAYAVGQGVLVVAAAGNNASADPSYPAAYPQVVAVAATDAAGHAASFSNSGPWVTVAAPGVNITGTAPTGGSNIFPLATSGYAVASGTSFASPIVSAEAALLWSLQPTAPASDIRQAIVSSSHGYANLGLGAGQVDFRAAYNALRPDSIPSLTQPANGSTVSGVVPLSATSTAPRVRFQVNGVPVGSPVATSSGVARTTWASWGVANGQITITAVDCSLANVCNAQPGQLGVTLANQAPALTSPLGSQTLGGWAALTATAPGGGVAFVIDGVRRGFDGVAPYALRFPVSSLVNGTHTIQAVSCSVTGTSCAGPASTQVSFIARSLHPKITAVSPLVFSPNGDGRYETTRATYYLPDAENVHVQIRNSAGTIVRGPFKLGPLSAGTHAITWNGVLNSGTRAHNGTYTFELVTSRTTASGTIFGAAAGRVRVDVTAPAAISVIGSGARFYPYPDSYKDLFSPRFSLNEKATVTLNVRTTSGVLVRAVAGVRAVGAATISWNGTNAAGARVAAGTYYWTLTTQDSVRNHRASPRYSVVVSSQRLIAKTATLLVRGAQYTLAGGSASCAQASKAASQFAPYGVSLVNRCDQSVDGGQIAASVYRFTLPVATSYTSFRVDTYGRSVRTSKLGCALTRWTAGDHSLTPEITVGTAIAWRTIGTVAATGLVNASRQVEATLYVPNEVSFPNDYDVSHVRLVASYKLLV